MLKFELDQDGNVVYAKGTAKAGNIKRHGIFKASLLED